jgi:chromosome segregation ATPase
MLEKQDIQTIAEIFHSSMNPIKEELQNVKGEVLGLKEQVQDVQSEVQEVKEQVQGVEGEVRELKEQVQGVEGEVRELKGQVQGVQSEVLELKEQVHGVEGKARELEGHVQGIRLTLENETNKNINIVAEGYLNLSRKLDEALKVENEKEMLLIRVNRLENGYRTLQEQVESIAQG